MAKFFRKKSAKSEEEGERESLHREEEPDGTVSPREPPSELSAEDESVPVPPRVSAGVGKPGSGAGTGASPGLDREEAPEEERSLKSGLAQSRRLLLKPFSRAAARKAIDPAFWEEAEEALIEADTGVECSKEVLKRAREIIVRDGVRSMDGVREAFRRAVMETLVAPEGPILPCSSPSVVFVVGVNGVGKTTTCAKLGYLFKTSGMKVLFAAADTFRAAGIEQMEIWAQRVGAPVVRHRPGGDPAAVVYDSIESAVARGIDVVIVDTAGRLHTKKNLMDELSKMWRVAERRLGSAAVGILVIDATTGQNGISQARLFSQALKVHCIALTKMDGTAKGGVVMAIGREFGIPVAFVGVGEGLGDLKAFDPLEYAKALF